MNYDNVKKYKEFRDKIINKERYCHFSKYHCFQPAIKSHVIQESGIISKLSTKGIVYTVHFDFFKKQVQFKDLGQNDALAFKGFCHKHDEQIFAPIEKVDLGNIDFKIRKTQLLYLYRAILHEKFKKEVEYKAIEYLSKLKKNRFDIKNDLESYQFGLVSSIVEIDTIYLNMIEKDLVDDKSNHLICRAFQISKPLPICCSSLISLTPLQNDVLEIFNIDNSVITTIFSIEEKTIVILGFLKQFEFQPETIKLIDHLENCNESELIQFISNIVVYNSEDWVMSVDFYTKKIKPNLNFYVNLLNSNVEHYGINYTNTVNLFETL